MQVHSQPNTAMFGGGGVSQRETMPSDTRLRYNNYDNVVDQQTNRGP